MKQCKRCGLNKSAEKFETKRQVCRECMCAAQRRTKAVKVARFREIINQRKSVPCADCGEIFPPICMDFDHLPGFVKDFGIAKVSNGNVSEARLLAEMDKCEVVCANCHRLRTQARLQ